MQKFSAEPWYAREAAKADLAYGQAAKEIILKELRAILRKA